MAGVLQKVDASDEPCVSMLTELGVKSTTYAHPLATTVEEQGQHVTGIEVRAQEAMHKTLHDYITVVCFFFNVESYPESCAMIEDTIPSTQ